MSAGLDGFCPGAAPLLAVFDLCGSGEFELEPWLWRRTPVVLPGLGLDGLLTISRSTYLTKGTLQGELISDGRGELLGTDTVDETIVPSLGLGGIPGSPRDRWPLDDLVAAD